MCTNEEQDIIGRNSKKSARFLQDLMDRVGGGSLGGRKMNRETGLVDKHKENLLEIIETHLPPKEKEAMLKAVEHKNKLLEYDRTR